MTVKDLTNLFNCSRTYISIILDRFNFPKVEYKNKGKFYDINKDFAYKVCDFMRTINNKKSQKIIKILEELEI